MSYGQTNEFDKAVLKLSKVKPKNYADIDAILKRADDALFRLIQQEKPYCLRLVLDRVIQ